MIDRDIAVLARTLVESRIQAGETHEEETAYRSLCEGLPILLRTAGLTRAVTFLDAKKGKDPKKSEHGVLLSHLEQQLKASGVYSDTQEKTLNLGEYVVSSGLSMTEYCHLSSLALRVAYWHKRLAQALLRQKED